MSVNGSLNAEHSRSVQIHIFGLSGVDVIVRYLLIIISELLKINSKRTKFLDPYNLEYLHDFRTYDEKCNKHRYTFIARIH